MAAVTMRGVEFRILRRRKKAKSSVTSLDFRRPDFSLFRDLLPESCGRPWTEEGSRRAD